MSDEEGLAVGYIEGLAEKIPIEVDDETNGFTLRNYLAQKANIGDYTYLQVWVINDDVQYPVPMIGKVCDFTVFV